MASSRMNKKMIRAKIVPEKEKEDFNLLRWVLFAITCVFLTTAYQFFCVMCWNMVFVKSEQISFIAFTCLFTSVLFFAIQNIPFLRKKVFLLLGLLPWLWLAFEFLSTNRVLNAAAPPNATQSAFGLIYRDFASYYKLPWPFSFQMVSSQLADRDKMRILGSYVMAFAPFSYVIMDSFFGKARKMVPVIGAFFSIMIVLLTGQTPLLFTMVALGGTTGLLLFFQQEQLHHRMWKGSTYLSAALMSLLFVWTYQFSLDYTRFKVIDTLEPLQDYLYHSSLEEIVSDVKDAYANNNATTTMGGGLSGGKVSMAGNIVISTTTDMVLYVSKPVHGVMYLKGFTGDEYTGKEWRPITEPSFYNDYQMMTFFTIESNLGKDHVYLEIAYSPYMKERVEPYIRVRLDNAQHSGVTDVFATFSWEEEELRQLLKEYRPIMSGFDDSDLLLTQQTYEEWMGDSFLDVPKSLTKLREDVNDYMSVPHSLEEKLIFVRDYLKEHAEYSLSPGRMGGKDFVESFLYEKHKGYCMHFASAATAMFRLMGIPARYAEGYVVWEANDPMIFLSGRNAHAWPEIYIPGLGWIPIEVTPGYSGSVNGVGETKPVEATDATEHTTIEDPALSATEVTSREQTQQPEGETTNTKETIEGASDSTTETPAEPVNRSGWGRVFKTLLFVTICVIMICGLFAGALSLLWDRRAKRKRNMLHQKDRRKAVIAIYSELGRLLKTQGVAYSHETTPDMLIATCPKLSSNEEVFLATSGIECALFGNQEIEEEQYKAVYWLYRTIRNEIIEKSSYPKRIWLLVIRGF